MENQPSYALKLSLTEIALRRVVVNLCNETDILTSIVNFRIKGLSDRQRRNAWREIVQDEVKIKLTKLVLPEVLKTKIMHVVKPIGAEILNWKKFHENYLSDSMEEFDLPVLEKLHWTSSGTVDYQKTAEELIRCEMLKTVNRYKLACLYCLEDYIHILWNELPENISKYFYNELSSSNMRQPSLQFCWPYILKGEESKLINIFGVYNRSYSTFHEYAFGYSSFTGNKSAAAYFFQKLSIEEREASLFNAALDVFPLFDVNPRGNHPWVYRSSERFPRGKITDTFCYLLSLMKHEQQMLEKLFKEYTYCILLCFLEWPWQDVLLEIADHIWHHLSAEDYVRLLVTLANSLKESEYYLPNIFREFFTRCPVNFVTEYFDKLHQSDRLFRLFSFVFDPNAIKVIFRDLDSTHRVRLVSCEVFFELFFGRIGSSPGPTVEAWFREAALSQEDRKTVKKAFVEFLARATKGQIQDNDPRLHEFSVLLDKSALKKRRAEEEIEKLKKLCS